MTFLEVLVLIGERGDKIISEKVHSIQTDKHLYARASNGDWEEREPLPTVERFVPIPYECTVKEVKKDK